MENKIIPYDTGFDPPAPALEVVVLNPNNRRLRKAVYAILDTGADITAIPETMIELLKLYPVSTISIEGVDSQKNILMVYKINLNIFGVVILNLQVIPVKFQFAVLARDTLNQFHIQLNGPSLSFSISHDSSE